jgi:hypothetical protein
MQIGIFTSLADEQSFKELEVAAAPLQQECKQGG